MSTWTATDKSTLQGDVSQFTTIANALLVALSSPQAHVDAEHNWNSTAQGSVAIIGQALTLVSDLIAALDHLDARLVALGG